MGKKSPNQLDDSVIKAAADALRLARDRGIEDINPADALRAVMKSRQDRLARQSHLGELELKSGLDPDSLVLSDEGALVFSIWDRQVEDQALVDQQG